MNIDVIFALILPIVGLILLLLISAFFSGSETGLMAINRYRLRHAVKKNDAVAHRVNKLLSRPDRLLGVILIGNTFANVLASSFATMLAIHYLGDVGVLIVTIVLTLFILIFAEILPKTLAALHAWQVARFVSMPLARLLRLFYPLVWVGNLIANGVLRCFGVDVAQQRVDALSEEELKSVVAAGTNQHSNQMLLGVLDLQAVTIEDIMVPKREIVGIDLNDDWLEVQSKLLTTSHTRLPVYRDEINQVIGIVDVRNLLPLMAESRLTKGEFVRILSEVYFIPESVSLNTQLVCFQRESLRMGLVVDEYGDVQGLVTLEDILEEVVGEMGEHAAPQIIRHKDGGYLVSGSITIRDLNRRLSWHLPEEGPKTLNGLVLEQVESMPSVGVSLKVASYVIEVVAIEENGIKQVKVMAVSA